MPILREARERIRREDEATLGPSGEASGQPWGYSRDVSGPAKRLNTTALGWPVPPRLLDYGPIAAIVLVGVFAVAKYHTGNGIAPRLALLLVVVISGAALVQRHRAPALTLAAVLSLSLALNNNVLLILPVLLALVNFVAYGNRSTVIIAAVAVSVVLLLTPTVHGVPLHGSGILSRLTVVGLAVAVGLYLRARADYVSGLWERAERLERESELLAEQAVADERLRIARELHDVVAHNVSLMVVQSQALAATGAAGPDGQAALGRVADHGREALSEMHRMLGVLRVQNGAAAEREPQPGVRDLERLIAHTREAGVETSLSVIGRARELPPGVDLSAYRIVQEALTNVIRHADAHQAFVTLTYFPDALDVSVLDDGRGPTSLANGNRTEGGHGLVGMRERVALFGGRLHTGPRADGPGYAVKASLPLA